MTTVRLCPLADVAHRLPADCWIAQRLAEEPDALADETTLWITGDAHWPALHLDAPWPQVAHCASGCMTCQTALVMPRCPVHRF